MTTFAPATFRERNRRSGISGFAMRAWRATNAASSAIETPPSPSVWAEPQPCSPASSERVDAEHQAAGEQHGAGDVGALA